MSILLRTDSSLPAAIRPSIGAALVVALKNVDPRAQLRNPVLFFVWCSSVITTVMAVAELFTKKPLMSGGSPMPVSFTWLVTLCLWLTVLAANLADALAQGRGQLSTQSLRGLQVGVIAHRIKRYDAATDPDAADASITDVGAGDLRVGDFVLLTGDDVVPADGEVVWGVASVDESAITGESARVIREAGGDRSGVTGGTKVLTDRIVVKVTAPAGATAVDRMIRLAQGAHRQKPPNELALSSLLAALSVSFILLSVALDFIASPVSPAVSITILVALSAVLLPTEIAALLAVTGIASTYHLLENNVLVVSGHALEAAGDITTVLLDKTGTITAGDRSATRFIPAPDVTKDELIGAAVVASRFDPTPEGTSTIRLASQLGFKPQADLPGHFVPFSASSRMSGIDLPDGTAVRKGSESAVLGWLKHIGTQADSRTTDALHKAAAEIAQSGGTPLAVAIKPPDEPGRILGVIQLKDVVKPSVPARIQQLRNLGVRTVMVTGDNPLTAKAIADEVGFDDYVGDAAPEDKLSLIKKEQAAGHFVAMSGDGTNDAPALAQADVAVAMNSATAAAKESANLIVLDDDPTKFVEIIETGRRQMTTRGALTTFNIANDLVRYFTFFPAMFVGVLPSLDRLNLLRLHTPASALLSTVIYSVVVIFLLIPMALAGVPYRMRDLGRALNLNLLYYGVGGLIVPIVGIKLIDLVVGLLPGY